MMRTVSLLLALALAGCNAAQTPAADNAVAGNETADDAVMGNGAIGNEAKPAAAATTPAQQAYAEANRKMHAGMGKIDADPDIAFIQGMIPHHRGAVDMAQTALKYGKDPQVRALAQSVIAAQEAEIAEMERWLAKRGGAAGAKPATAQSDPHAGH